MLRRAQEAWDLGATEVCVQAGLAPKMDGDLYIRLTRRIKEVLPDIHIHGFSPEEVLYGSVRSGWTIRDYLHRAARRRGRQPAGHRGRDPGRRAPAPHRPRPHPHGAVD